MPRGMRREDRRVVAVLGFLHGVVHSNILSIPVFLLAWKVEFGADDVTIGLLAAAGYGFYGVAAVPFGFLEARGRVPGSAGPPRRYPPRGPTLAGRGLPPSGRSARPASRAPHPLVWVHPACLHVRGFRVPRRPHVPPPTSIHRGALLCPRPRARRRRAGRLGDAGRPPPTGPPPVRTVCRDGRHSPLLGGPARGDPVHRRGVGVRLPPLLS